MLYSEWQRSCWWVDIMLQGDSEGGMQTSCGSQSVMLWTKKKTQVEQSDDSNWSLLTGRRLSVEPHCVCPQPITLSYFCLHASQPACICVRCPFMRCSAGPLRSPHCPIWSPQGRIMKGYTPRVATTKRDLVVQNKKQAMLCNTLMLLLLFLMVTESRRKAKGMRRDKDKMTGRQGPFRDGWAAQAFLPKNCADTISVLGVLFTQSYTKANSTAAWHHWLEAKQNSSLLLPSISNLTDESTCLHPRSHYCCWVWSVLTSASAYCLQSLVKKALFKCSFFPCSLWFYQLCFQFMLTHSSQLLDKNSDGTWRA